jgi:hypothetical protein
MAQRAGTEVLVVHPDPKRRRTDDDVDLRADEPLPAAAQVRAVLESAADVIFSDGVSPEFLDQWTFETVQLLEARAGRDRNPSRRRVRASH